jgi:lipopolysaccharide export system protein LptA
MLRSEAARYARWSAAIALALAGVTAIVYLERGWIRHVEKKTAPPPAPVDVSRQSVGINFKKGEGNHTTFEVAASHSTEFKGQDASLIEDVKITIFGKAGDRHDIIHTQSCRYGSGIVCAGDVQIDLLSALDAVHTANNPAAAAARTTHVETRGVRFDRASGVAQTNQRVTFKFPNGTGSATGLEYKSEEGTVRLLNNVQLTLTQSAASDGNAEGADRPAQQEVHVRGTSLDFSRDTRVMHLRGPAEAETPKERLSAGEITLLLDKNFRAEKLIAAGTIENRPVVTSQGTQDQLKLDADVLTAHFSPQGAVTWLEASGAVHGFRGNAADKEEAQADSGTLELWPGVNQPRELNLSGNVVLKTEGTKNGEIRLLRTSAFRMEFSGGKAGESGKAEKAETLAGGAIEWTDAVQPDATVARTKLTADKLEMHFGAEGKARQLLATGNVQTERSVTGHPLQTATARNAVADLQATGGWSQMDLNGDVKLKEGDRAGLGDHAVFVRASQTATLTGHAAARDAATETHAAKITFSQATGEIHAEGGVRSTDFSSGTSAIQLAPAPVNITANDLQANSKTGRALYSGKARLWQGDSVLEADSIELLRESRVLNAAGNVRAVFPQAPRQAPGPAGERVGALGSSIVPTQLNAAQPATKKPQLWHAICETLTYQDGESHAHLERNVMVQSAEQRMRAPALELYLARAGQNIQNAPGGGSPLGPQQISRAVGSGGVVIEEGSRKATAERGEYIATNGKFEMSGGTPTLYDGSAGTTTGRKLTFFLADDTIIVDSENGSRTLTKHRVEK